MKRVLIIIIFSLTMKSIYSIEMYGQILQENSFPFDPFPIRDKEVNLLISNEVVHTSFTDNEGFFYFSNIESGNYSLKIDSNLYPIVIDDKLTQKIDTIILKSIESLSMINKDIFDVAIKKQADNKIIDYINNIYTEDGNYYKANIINADNAEEIRNILNNFWIDVPYILSESEYGKMIENYEDKNKNKIIDSYELIDGAHQLKKISEMDKKELYKILND